jgi:hypothetical protein
MLRFAIQGLLMGRRAIHTGNTASRWNPIPVVAPAHQAAVLASGRASCALYRS